MIIDAINENLLRLGYFLRKVRSTISSLVMQMEKDHCYVYYQHSINDMLTDIQHSMNQIGAINEIMVKMKERGKA